MYSFIGLVAKGDIYTDIAFLVEMQKCNDERSGPYNFSIFMVSMLVFCCTLLYQSIWFLKL